jgi:hypothetical protein
VGHRKNRKKERRWADDGPGAQPAPRARRRGGSPDLFIVPPPEDDYALLLAMSRAEKPVAQKQCGTCREFVEDQEGGRGECLHPGSGVLAPWTDTPGCQFHDRVRGVSGYRR